MRMQTSCSAGARAGGAGRPRGRLARLILLGALSSTLLAWPDRAAAQDCGSWPRPVLCDARLRALSEDRREERLDEQSRLRLAPRGRLDLLVEGRDQRGRPFPADRLSLGYEEFGCRGLLNIEDRGRQGLRVTARSDASRCRLTVWVPGNLNFQWELDIDVDPGARITYSRTEADAIVHALYRAVLGREADAGSVRAATSEIQQGRLENLIASMTASPEFRQSIQGVAPEALLDRFYEGIFGRQADTGGVREYLGSVRSGQHASVLLRMIRSPEFERRLSG